MVQTFLLLLILEYYWLLGIGYWVRSERLGMSLLHGVRQPLPFLSSLSPAPVFLPCGFPLPNVPFKAPSLRRTLRWLWFPTNQL